VLVGELQPGRGVVPTSSSAQSQDAAADRGARLRRRHGSGDVMDQVADDFIGRLRRVGRQLCDVDDSRRTGSLEHELLQCALECT